MDTTPSHAALQATRKPVWENDEIHKLSSCVPDSSHPIRNRAAALFQTETGAASFESAWLEYQRRYVRILEGREAPKCAIITHNGDVGFGNRAGGIASTFLISLLSDRVFFVNSSKFQFHDLFQEPTFESALGKQVTIVYDWNHAPVEFRSCGDDIVHYSAHDLVLNDVCNNANFRNARCIAPKDPSYFLAHLLRDNQVNTTLSALYMALAGTRGFFRASRKIFIPHMRYREQILQFSSEMQFSAASYAVGVHIRSRKLQKTLDVSNLESSLVRGIYGTQWLRHANIHVHANQGQYVDEFFRTARFMTLDRISRDAERDLAPSLHDSETGSCYIPLVFVTADAPWVLHRAARYFQQFLDVRLVTRLCESRGVVSNILPNSFYCLEDETTDLLDLYKLAMCDDLVVTTASSFSWVAVGWKGERAVQISPRRPHQQNGNLLVDHTALLTSDMAQWHAVEEVGDYWERAEYTLHKEMHPMYDFKSDRLL